MAEQGLDPKPELGSGGSTGPESPASARRSSKVSFFLKSTSGSKPVSENSHGVSMMLNASPDSNTFFAFSKSGSGASEINLNLTQRDPFPFTYQDSSATTSSLLSFSLMHAGLPRSSREEQMFKERGSIISSFVSLTKTATPAKPAVPETRLAHRLIPHRPSPKISSIPENIQKRILPFYVTLEQLKSVKNLMVAAMEKGLKQKEKITSYLPMLPTYISALPDGSGKHTLQFHRLWISILTQGHQYSVY